MLVLTLKTDEKVMIGDELEVVLVEIRGSQVKLGFSGPPETPIHRYKVWNRIRLERERRRAEEAGREGAPA